MSDDFEYYETTPEVDQDAGAPPKGLGWELVEVVQLGKLQVHRWRRPHVREQTGGPESAGGQPTPAHKVPDRSS